MASIQEAVQRERNLQGIVVLTDGNDTVGDQGTLLATMLAGRKLPVFPVVFGEYVEPKIASVKISSTTPYVRLGDEFRLNVTLSATNLGEQIVGVDVFVRRAHRSGQSFDQARLPIASRKYRIRSAKSRQTSLSPSSPFPLGSRPIA